MIAEGSSIDVYLAELGQKYENLQQENANNKKMGLPPKAILTDEEMMAMVKGVKNKRAK